MKTIHILIFCCSLLALFSCSKKKNYEKGFSLSPETETAYEPNKHELAQDSTPMLSRPNSVLLTGYPEYRLSTIYKLNYNEKEDAYFTGSNSYYRNYSECGYDIENEWNYNFMPGLEAVYGYNLVNVSLKNVKSQEEKLFFNEPVLIKTLYFPSFSKDTLFGKPVKRNYYMISAYDEDSNGDGSINSEDLRHFYVFNLDGKGKESLIPKEYSVVSSEYDCVNDYMYVFAQLDENNNGQREETEQVHIFWIDLKDPHNRGRQF